jgi:hypothetical protein
MPESFSYKSPCPFGAPGFTRGLSCCVHPDYPKYSKSHGLVNRLKIKIVLNP